MKLQTRIKLSYVREGLVRSGFFIGIGSAISTLFFHGSDPRGGAWMVLIVGVAAFALLAIESIDISREHAAMAKRIRRLEAELGEAPPPTLD